MSLLEVQDLTIGYCAKRKAPHVVAKGLNLELREGILTCLLGPNGAGKSTLLRTIAGLQPALNGTITLDKRPLSSFRPAELARRFSLVLTERVPVGTLAVWSLVAMGRYPHTDWLGHLSSHDEEVVHGAIQALGIEPLAYRPMCDLSDGERQKVMIARALAQEPAVMILDEATAHLDLPRRIELMQLLQDLARERHCAVLLSCHDLDLSLRNAHRLWLLSGNGIMREGVPEDLVLTGDVDATFADASMAFDVWSGGFVPPRRVRGRIAVDGDPLAVTWVRRALERLGFVVVSANAEWEVTVQGDQGELPSWQLRGARQVQGRSIESLLNAVIAPRF